MSISSLMDEVQSIEKVISDIKKRRPELGSSFDLRRMDPDIKLILIRRIKMAFDDGMKKDPASPASDREKRLALAALAKLKNQIGIDKI